MNIPDTLRLENPRKLKHALRTTMEDWLIAFFFKAKAQGRFRAEKPPLRAFKHYFNRQLAKLRPHRAKSGVTHGFWQLPCKLSAGEVWQLFERSADKVMLERKISIVTYVIGHANDNRLRCGYSIRGKSPSVKQHQPAAVVPKPKRPAKAKWQPEHYRTLTPEQLKYVQWWESKLFLQEAEEARRQAKALKQLAKQQRGKPVTGKQRKPLTEAERQAIAQAEAKRKQAARPAPHKVRHLLTLQEQPPAMVPAEPPTNLLHQLYEAIQQPWFFSTDRSHKRRKRQFLHQPGMQDAYNAFRAMVRKNNRTPTQEEVMAEIRDQSTRSWAEEVANLPAGTVTRAA